MLIAVLMRCVPKTDVFLEIAADGRSIITDDLVYVMNPYDEYALEEAVRLKESFGGEVIAICVGDDRSGSIMRSALAAGADRAVRIDANKGLDFRPRAIARAMSTILSEQSPDLILAGCQVIDTNDAQVPEETAEIMGLSHISFVTRVEVENGNLLICQEMEGGYREIEVALPALITVQRGINVPRYPTVPEVMKAKRKPLEIRKLGDIVPPGEIQSCVEVDVLEATQKTRSGRILSGDLGLQISELISILNGASISD